MPSDLPYRFTAWIRWGITLSLPVLASGLFWWSRPAPVILSQFTTTLTGRSSAQLRNIATAAAALDHVLIQPGEIFSFNHSVGPRTRLRGYVEAPAFMTATTVDSVGGGICQVSSSLYNAALQAGLEIEERQAHYTTVQSVPAGLDATVWYGQVDLKLQNPYPWPVRLETEIRHDRLIIKIAGKQPAAPVSLHIDQKHFNLNQLQVRVYRGHEQISDDVYYVKSQSP